MKTMALLLLGSSFLLACAAQRQDGPVAAPRPHTAPTPPSPVDPDAEALATGRRWVAAFYDRKTQAMWDVMSSEMRKLFGDDKNGLDAFRRSLDELGPETEVLEE